MNSKLKSWSLPVLSGILIGTSYIPFPPWASLFGFVPLWLFWSRQTRFRDVFLGGLTTSFVFTLIGFNWVTYMLHEFAHLDWPVAVLGMIFYGLIAHLYVPWPAYLVYRTAKIQVVRTPFIVVDGYHHHIMWSLFIYPVWLELRLFLVWS